MKILTIPLHIGDWLGGTLGWDATEIGAYMNLTIAHYLAGEDGISANEKELAKIARCTLKTWRRISPRVLSKFTVTSDVIVSSKVVDVIRQINLKSSIATANALKRHNSNHASAEQTHSGGNASQSQSPKPKTIAASSSMNNGDNSGDKSKEPVIMSNVSRETIESDDPTFCADEYLPSAWDDHAYQHGITDVDQRFATWKKFKKITTKPYSRSKWQAWLRNEPGYYLPEAQTA